MFEKVNPAHPDKVADRIAGAIVDIAYALEEDPRIAVEVLIGHGKCHIIAETSVSIPAADVEAAVHRIAGDIDVDYREVPQDVHLAANQKDAIRCGDNGIFRGVPVTEEQDKLSRIAREIYSLYPFDGKYVLDEANDRLTICQSNAPYADLKEHYTKAQINPLGDWTGGPDVDTGATNRKLGSDMADSVTGGGLCLSGDSEFLSDDLRWHRMDSYQAGQLVGQYGSDGQLEFVLPERYIQNESDNFILFENDTKLSMCLTPFHEILIETSKGNLVKHPALTIADSILSHRGNPGFIRHAFLYDRPITKSKYIDDNDYRLQIAFCADGTILGANRKWTGRVRVKRQRKIERMRELLKGRPYREAADCEYSIFYFSPTILSKSLYECFRDEDLSILREEVFRWDGDEEREVFRTTHKEDADFVQFAFASKGTACGISIIDRLGEIYSGGYERKSICYIVHPYASVTSGLRDNKGSEVTVKCLEQKAPSYCFTVPSHNLIIRHNNRIFITGNCGKDLSKADVSVNIYAWLKAQKTGKPVELCCAIGDETVDGKPYSEIVEIAREYIQQKGGFERFAEWGLI